MTIESDAELSSMTNKSNHIRIPWGAWIMTRFNCQPLWQPNPRLDLSAGDQYRQNIENGFIEPPEGC